MARVQGTALEGWRYFYTRQFGGVPRTHAKNSRAAEGIKIQTESEMIYRDLVGPACLRLGESASYTTQVQLTGGVGCARAKREEGWATTELG